MKKPQKFDKWHNNHRTKSHVTAFFIRNGNTELHVSATFKLCGNVSNQVLAILSSIDTDALNKMAGLVSLWAKVEMS